MEIDRCVCGRMPHYDEERKCCGHGEFPLFGQISCRCGRSTGWMLVEDYYSYKVSSDDVIALWNEFHGVNRDSLATIK